MYAVGAHLLLDGGLALRPQLGHPQRGVGLSGAALHTHLSRSVGFDNTGSGYTGSIGVQAVLWNVEPFHLHPAPAAASMMPAPITALALLSIFLMKNKL